MGFQVNTTLLDLYSGLLAAEHDHATQADRYAHDHLNGPAGRGGGGLFDLIDPMQDAARSQVQDAMKRLVDLCEQCAHAMQQAASMYDRTDRASASRLDATYPDAPSPPERGLPWIPGGSTAGLITETQDPVGKLAPPGDPPAFKDPADVLNTISSYLSPSTVIQKGLDLTLGLNPAKELSKELVGDWKGIAQMGQALGALSKFCGAVGGDIGSNAANLVSGWNGHAADSAYQYFNDLANRLHDYEQQLASLSDQYNQSAFCVSQFAAAVEGDINSIMDTVFWIGVEALGGAAGAETGVAPVAAGAAIFFEVRSVIKTWSELTKLFSETQHTIRISAGVIGRVLGDGLFKAKPLPVAYHHPGVAS